jgi:lipopolysaccharide transport system permease protein
VTEVAPIAPPTQWHLLAKDVVDSLRLWRLWSHLGWADILKQYRRSALGPLWISVNTALFIVLFGLIGAQLFSMPVETYLPFFCVGNVIFAFFSLLLNEGCKSFIGPESLPFLKQAPYPKIAFVLRVVWRNVLMFAHNLPVALGVLWWSGGLGQIRILWLLPGLALTLLAGTLAVAILGAVAARFRDVPMLVASVMQIAFFVTPVIWRPEQLTERAQQVVLWNPLAAYLDLLRAPMLGQAPTNSSVAIAIGVLVLLAAVFVAIYVLARRRIVYWL